MAQAIMKANGAGTFSSRGDIRLEIDILNNYGAGALANYAAQAYDNSGDYWKLMEDGSLEFDGDGWLRDSNNNYILDENEEKIGAQGVQGGLAAILQISSNQAAAMLYDQEFVFVEEEGVYWKNNANNGLSITMNNQLYAQQYEALLAVHNTMNIYNSLVMSGNIEKNPQYDAVYNSFGLEVANNIFDSEYISYEEYKENNFIQGNADIQVNNLLTNYDVSTLFGATGNLSAIPHYGVDFATPTGTAFTPFIWNEQASVIDSGPSSNLAQGNIIITSTPISYMYKGRVINENLYARYLHLNFMSVIENDNIDSLTILGETGNTGQWNDLIYSPHLHFDMYTDNQSPYMDYLNMQNNSNYVYTNNDYYYDPFLFLDESLYNIRDDAGEYNAW